MEHKNYDIRQFTLFKYFKYRGMHTHNYNMQVLLIRNIIQNTLTDTSMYHLINLY